MVIFGPADFSIPFFTILAIGFSGAAIQK